MTDADKPGQNAAKCPACNGNDRNIPCAYPGDHEQQPGCLRTERLARQAAWEKSAPEAAPKKSFAERLRERGYPDAPTAADSRRKEAATDEGDLQNAEDALIRCGYTYGAKTIREAAATVAALRREVEQIREALAGDDYASLPSDLPVVRMAHTIREDHDKFRNQVRDTCRRAEAAERELAACREDAERYRWLCDDLSTEEQRDERHRLCMRMGVMGKGAIDAAIKAARGEEEKPR